jgi:hypothetical protein
VLSLGPVASATRRIADSTVTAKQMPQAEASKHAQGGGGRETLGNLLVCRHTNQQKSKDRAVKRVT